MSAESEMLHGELDYLWKSVRDAQDSEARSAGERASAREALDRAVARIAFLENELTRAAERETKLKAAARDLKTALEHASGELAAAAQRAGKGRDLETELLAGKAEAATMRAELTRLRAEAAGLREALKGRAETIELLTAKAAAVASLPEVAAAIAADAAASGRSASLYDHLAARAEKERLEAERLAGELLKAEQEAAAARAAAAAAQATCAGLSGELAAAGAQLEELRAAAGEAAQKALLTAEERAAVDGRALALKAALEERETSLASARADAALLRRGLDDAAAEAARLREEAARQAERTEEQRRNFAEATAQVFRLQELSAGLKAELASAREKNQALAAELDARLADIDKVNGLFRDARTDLAQEKESSRRAAVKSKSLGEEIEALKKKLGEAADYSGRLLRAVEERELVISALKQDFKKVEALELENEDLRRKNVKFSGLVQREQSDFSARTVRALEKTVKALKTFSMRVPAAERKGLDQVMKTLLASVNVMKAWQEYMDPETPDLADTELGTFFAGEVGKWERAFKQRKISVAAVIATPRLRARVDAERMKMLVYQLVKNAYENLQPGGNLRVTLKGSEDGRWAGVTFEDNGPGFARETLEKLFAPFNTAAKDRTGIGLAVARRIAEKHGGTLAASNRKDRGALVELRLPLGN